MYVKVEQVDTCTADLELLADTYRMLHGVGIVPEATAPLG